MLSVTVVLVAVCIFYADRKKYRLPTSSAAGPQQENAPFEKQIEVRLLIPDNNRQVKNCNFGSD